MKSNYVRIDSVPQSWASQNRSCNVSLASAIVTALAFIQGRLPEESAFMPPGLSHRNPPRPD